MGVLGLALLLHLGWSVGVCLWDLDQQATLTQDRTRPLTQGGSHA